MYAVLGEIEFKVVTFWDGFKSTMGVDYATHARIEGKPGVQFIGDKLDMLALEFSPIKGPEGNIEYLVHLKKTGRPMGQISEDLSPQEIVRIAHESLDKN